MYFCRTLARKGRNGKDLLLCAARHGGIGIVEVRWGDVNYSMRTAVSSEVDAVDVCFVGGEPEAPAVAAVGRDGSLFLVRDVLHDKKPVKMKFDTVRGRVYRILSTRGHLFLLTSIGLYGLMNLGNRLMQGLPAGKFTTPIFVVPLEAVDASLVGARWLPVIMPDEVLRFDLDLIDTNMPEDVQEGETRKAAVGTVDETSETTDESSEFEEISTGSMGLAEVS
jgi:hypothetical protein